MCATKRSAGEGHRKVLWMAENLDAQGVGESLLVRFLVGVFWLRGRGIGLLASLPRRWRSKLRSNRFYL